MTEVCRYVSRYTIVQFKYLYTIYIYDLDQIQYKVVLLYFDTKPKVLALLKVKYKIH